MPLPDLPDLHELLSRLELSTQKNARHDAAVQIPFRPSADESGKVHPELTLWLHHPLSTKVTFRGLIERISKELGANHHRRHDDFALFVLSLAMLMPKTHGHELKRLNSIINTIGNADANLFYILYLSLPQYYKFEIPPFSMGPLNIERFRYCSEKAASDYFTRYQDRLRGTWAIERAPVKVRLLDLTQVREMTFDDPITQPSRRQWERSAWEAIANGYFSLHNRLLFEDFWAELISAQAPLLALGAPFFDPRSVASIVQAFHVAIFLNIGRDKKGFVAPTGIGEFRIDLAHIYTRVPNIIKELQQSYNFKEFDDSPLHQSIKLFTDFMGRAQRHELDGRLNEALLHFVIALELIFGEQQAIQKSVSERVATLTYRLYGRSFKQQCEWINGFYDMRSKYVHTGVEITDDVRLGELRVLSGHVFRCLMKLQSVHVQPSSRGESALNDWLLNLDYIAKGLVAGKQPTETQFRDAFIAHAE